MSAYLEESLAVLLLYVEYYPCSVSECPHPRQSINQVIGEVGLKKLDSLVKGALASKSLITIGFSLSSLENQGELPFLPGEKTSATERMLVVAGNVS
jgi:hypothetical protein